MKVKVLRNIGSAFYREHEMAGAMHEGNKQHEEDKVYDVDDKLADLLLKKGLAELVEVKVHAVPSAPAVRGVPKKTEEPAK